MDNNSQQIFSNLFLLKFQNNELQEKYSEKIKQKVLNHNLIYTIFHFILSLIVTLVICYSYTDYISRKFLPILFTSITMTSLYVVLIVIALIGRKNYITTKIINYINFFLLALIFGILRNHVINIVNSGFGYAAIAIFEFLFRQVYMMLGTLNFLESCIIMTLNILTYWIYWTQWFDISFIYYRNLTFTILWIFEAIIYYFYLKEEKRSFFYLKESESRCDWYMNILDNMNTGLLHIKNGSINYLNKEIYSRLVDEVNNKQYLKEKNLSEITTNTKPIIENILADIEPEFLSEQNLSKYLETERHFGIFLEYLKQAAIERGEINSFLRVGTKTFEFDNNSNKYYITYDIFCRFYFNINKTEDNFEFMFNDITNTQKILEKRMDDKYKTLYLAKICHEFKNPLICISELSSQIQEAKNFTKRLNYNEYSYPENKIDNLTKLINSLTNYLLIMIRDMDYLANKQQNPNIEANELNISDLINFCKEIADCLLFNSNKRNSVKFIVKLDNELINQSFVLEEFKIKQILINLIASKIKSLNTGTIDLEVKSEQTTIKFKISESNSSYLTNIKTKKLDKMHTYNAQNSGLGLFIAKELAESLNTNSIISEVKQHNIQSDDHKSDFWFAVNKIMPNGAADQIVLTESFIKVVSNHLHEKTENSLESNNQLNKTDNTIKVENFKMSNPFLSGLINKDNVYFNNVQFNYNKIIINSPDQYKIPQINKKITIYSNDSNSENDSKNDYDLNIILMDDEFITRKAALRVLKIVLAKLDIKANIIEAEDGIECLSIFYKSITKTKRIDLIISDETMCYMNGSDCAKAIRNICINKQIEMIPFYIITAYQNSITLKNVKNDGVRQVYSKPVTKNVIETILNELKQF